MRIRKALDVLIIDDDPLLRSGLRSLLEREGFGCGVAGAGREGLDLARRSPPQCVFVDIGLPDLDGLAVARQLRADCRTRDARLHCLTGSGGPAARRRARRAGCEVFLTKPVGPESLLEVVRRDVSEPRRQWVSGLTVTEVRELADWLEGNGCTGVEVSCQGEAGFTLGCVCPPGVVLGTQDARVLLFRT